MTIWWVSINLPFPEINSLSSVYLHHALYVAVTNNSDVHIQSSEPIEI